MLSGKIEKVLYKNNDFVVIFINNTKACGKLPGAKEGMVVTLYGRIKKHPKYGEEYHFTEYKKHKKTDYYYLSSGLIKNVGERTAKNITEMFPDAVETILKDPLKLTLIKGISAQRAKEIADSVKRTLKYREIAADLAPCRLSPSVLIRIYEQLKNYREVLKNPYILTQVDLIGFRKADIIAQRLGISLESEQRLQAACLYEMNQSVKEGHVYLTERELAERVYRLLNKKISPDLIEKNIEKLELPREKDRIYFPDLLKAENYTAEFFAKIKNCSPIDITEHIENYDISLSDKQKKAVRLAFSTNVLIITGGPGTGKTETIRAITKIYRKLYPDHKISLAAPTGRASRRMEEVTGLKAQTIHTLISSRKKLNIDLLIIDETSMVDIELLYNLLYLIENTKLIFVGDADQLPSVGPGKVLKDMIGVLPTVKLNEVFRQAQESDIIVNAHRINAGSIDLKKGRDFYFINKETPEEILKTLREYALKYYRKKGNLHGLQFLTLMKKGTLGTDNLNIVLQDIAVQGEGKYRKGDRVIQLINNYSKGVLNGDIGIVKNTDPLIINYQGKEVQYNEFETDQITLAYAITVHKSQGSEFPVVAIPLHTQHYIILNRQILYTAITRAKKQVIIIGSYRALAMAVRNTPTENRNSALRKKLIKQLNLQKKQLIFKKNYSII